MLLKSCGEFYQKVVVIGLTALNSSLVAHGCTAFLATVYDNEALFGIGKRLYGAENAKTVVCSVTGVYVNVKRAKAEGTMIA